MQRVATPLALNRKPVPAIAAIDPSIIRNAHSAFSLLYANRDSHGPAQSATLKQMHSTLKFSLKLPQGEVSQNTSRAADLGGYARSVNVSIPLK